MDDTEVLEQPIERGSAFEVSHIILIDYPTEKLLLPQYRRVLLPPTNHRNRYAPDPLVSNNAVINHAGRTDHEETRYESFTKATMNMSDTWSTLAALRRETLASQQPGRLKRAMNIVCRCWGCTFLDIDTARYEGPGEDHGRIMIIIKRASRVRSQNSEFRDKATYGMKLGDFLELGIEQDWFVDIVDLVFRKSIRAARHVSLNCDVLEDPADWMVRQTIRLEDLSTVCSVVSMEALQQIANRDGCNPKCPVCWNPFKHDEGEESNAGELLCQHLVCRDCIMILCEAHGINIVKCPLCRAPLFKEDPTEPRHFFGVDDKGIYQIDNRYNDWENMERSLADLDENLAEEVDALTTFTIHSATLLRFWGWLVQHGRAEPASITPFHHNPALAVEFQVAIETVAFNLRLYEGLRMRPVTLFQLLSQALRSAYTARFATSPLALAINPRMRAERLSLMSENFEDGRDIFVFGTGFWEFVMRYLNRLINFAHMRRCLCNADGLHYHGCCRLYYNFTGSRHEMELEEMQVGFERFALA